jgi:hypothetical protein
MRNFSFSLFGFEKRLQNSIAPFQDRVKTLRSHVVDSPTFRAGDSYFHLSGYKSRELFELALISWYLGELGFLLRLDLEEINNKMEIDDKYKIPLGIVLKSKSVMLRFLEETSLWSSEEFFGTFLKKGCSPLSHLRLYIPSKKVTSPQRKRGYHDHGSRALDPAWKGARAFWKDTLLHYQIEEEKEIFQDTLSLVEGFLI